MICSLYIIQCFKNNQACFPQTILSGFTCDRYKMQKILKSHGKIACFGFLLYLGNHSSYLLLTLTLLVNINPHRWCTMVISATSCGEEFLMKWEFKGFYIKH